MPASPAFLQSVHLRKRSYFFIMIVLWEWAVLHERFPYLGIVINCVSLAATAESSHLFCAESLEQFYSWNIGKRRAAEVPTGILCV